MGGGGGLAILQVANLICQAVTAAASNIDSTLLPEARLKASESVISRSESKATVKLLQPSILVASF